MRGLYFVNHQWIGENPILAAIIAVSMIGMAAYVIYWYYSKL